MPEKGFLFLRYTRLFMFVAIGLFYWNSSPDLSTFQKMGLVLCTLVLVTDHFLMYAWDRPNLVVWFCAVDFIAASIVGGLFNAESNLYLIYFNVIAVTLFFETSHRWIIRGFLGSFLMVWISILLYGGMVRGEWHILDDLMNVGFVLFGCIIGYLVRKLMVAREMVANQYDQLNETHQALQGAHDQLERYTRQVEDLTSIQERNRIAREIHDTVGHKMTALLIQLQLAREWVAQDREEGKSTLETCETIAREALQELRVSVQTLRTEGQNLLTFPERIRQLLETFSTEAQIETIFQVKGDPSYISTSMQPTLHRMIQEGLTNAVRHGKATTCTISLNCMDDRIVCSIQDNGKGEGEVKPGFGLINMRERVALHGGTLRVESDPGKEFVLVADFPLKPQEWVSGGAL